MESVISDRCRRLQEIRVIAEESKSHILDPDNILVRDQLIHISLMVAAATGGFDVWREVFDEVEGFSSELEKVKNQNNLFRDNWPENYS